MPSPSIQMSQAVAINVITPVVQGSGAFLSAAIDLIDFEGVVIVTQNLGALSGAFTVPILTDSDTSGGTYGTIATSGALGTTASAITSVAYNVSEGKRFLKYSATVGTTAAISVTLHGFKKYR